MPLLVWFLLSLDSFCGNPLSLTPSLSDTSRKPPVTSTVFWTSNSIFVFVPITRHFSDTAFVLCSFACTGCRGCFFCNASLSPLQLQFGAFRILAIQQIFDYWLEAQGEKTRFGAAAVGARSWRLDEELPRRVWRCLLSLGDSDLSGCVILSRSNLWTSRERVHGGMTAGGKNAHF